MANAIKEVMKQSIHPYRHSSSAHHSTNCALQTMPCEIIKHKGLWVLPAIHNVSMCMILFDMKISLMCIWRYRDEMERRSMCEENNITGDVKRIESK